MQSETKLSPQEMVRLCELLLCEPLLAQYVDLFNLSRLDRRKSHFVKFLAWFLAGNRDRVARSFVITRQAAEIVTALDESGCHDLMRFAAADAKVQLSGRALQVWYYAYGMARARSFGFLSHNECTAIRKNGLLSILVNEAPGSPLVDALKTTTMVSQPMLPTISVVGMFNSPTGIGEDSRRLFDCLLAAGIPISLVDVSPQDATEPQKSSRYTPFSTKFPETSIVIFCLPIFEILRTVLERGFVKLSRQYWVGYCPWETSEIDELWCDSFKVVDEVWASSRFLHDVFSKEQSRPVYYMPPCVTIDDNYCGQRFNTLFDDKFSFISIFDFNSGQKRKNPFGLIDAFRMAFPSRSERVQLILKVMNATDPQRRSVLEASGGDRRVLLIEGELNKAEVCNLIASGDAYVSLHRSEGFGRPLAEAMLLGTPVLATGWSGCMDFLNEETGFPLPYTLEPVTPSDYPYAQGLWANPDVAIAAQMMRKLYLNGGASRRMLQRAKLCIQKQYGRNVVSRALLHRLHAITAAIFPFENQWTATDQRFENSEVL